MIIKIIIPLILFTLLFSGYAYLYENENYLMEHSTNLLTGNGVEKCKVGYGFSFFGSGYKQYLCDAGYYQVSYPTHERIFYYWYGTSEIGSSIHTVFLDNVDVNNFKALNKIYGSDVHGVYALTIKGNTIVQILSIDPERATVFNDADRYIKDDKSVFFDGKVLLGADSKNFQFVDTQEGELGFRLAKSNGVWFNGNEVIEVVQDGRLIVYHQGKEIPFLCKNKRTDPGSDRLVFCDNTDDGKDKKVTIDLESFTVMSQDFPMYMKDKNHSYILFMISGSKLHVIDNLTSNENISDTHVMGCKIFNGLKPNYNGRYDGVIERDSESGLCKYTLWNQ